MSDEDETTLPSDVHPLAAGALTRSNDGNTLPTKRSRPSSETDETPLIINGPSSEAKEVSQKGRHSPVPRPLKYIIRNFNPDEEDGPRLINDEEVVKSTNGKFYTWAECKRFRTKSTGHCPTYGNCIRCLKSGPVNKHCNECERQYEVGYKVMYLPNGTIIDAEYLSSIVGKNHETALANRTQDWIRTPSGNLSLDLTLHVRLHEKHQAHAIDKRKELILADKMLVWDIPPPNYSLPSDD